MRHPPSRPFVATLLAFSAPSFAVDATLTQGGYTGLGITPNAHILRWGEVATTYDKQLPGIVRNPTGHNLVAGFGLLPNLEISGRIAASTLNSNCFVEGCGQIRDLSASGKIGIGIDAANRFRVAAGVTDLGGAATNFRSYYGVLTYNEGPFEASAGLAKRPSVRGTNPRSPLSGPFAGLAFQPLPWVRGQLEYTDGNAWAGVRLFAPREWLPEGWTAHVGSNHRLNDNNLTRRAWLTAGISIPLYKVPDLPASGPKAPLPVLEGAQLPAPTYEARALPRPASPPPSAAVAQMPAPTPAQTQAPAPLLPLLDSQLDALAAALKAKGLEDIFVGRMPDGSVAVRANNDTYHWNFADAVGAALGAVSRTLGNTRAGYRIVLTQKQVPLVGVTGQADCLRQWINAENATCTAGQLSTPGTGALEPLLDEIGRAHV